MPQRIIRVKHFLRGARTQIFQQLQVSSGTSALLFLRLKHNTGRHETSYSQHYEILTVTSVAMDTGVAVLSSDCLCD